mgnify:CR=1 FL=1
MHSEDFVKEHQGRVDDVSICGQESNPTTWKLCKMNLAIRQIDNENIGLGDTFHNDKHRMLGDHPLRITVGRAALDAGI